jgi:hypothetical protein
LTLLVVDNGGIRYVAAKPINDLLGLAWRQTRDTIREGDNLELYGTRQLVPLNFDVLPEGKVSKTPVSTEADGGEETENGASRAAYFIRLDAVYLFMARVNTSKVRAAGNVSTADFLLELQKEWRQVLYAYETDGVAIKRGHKDGITELASLYKLRTLAESPAERASLNALIRDSFAEIGQPLPVDPQQALPL